MDNTVGSLTQDELSVIYGSLLGDGYMRIIPGRKSAFLEINHSIKARDYVDSKFSLLKNLCNQPPKERSGNEGRIAYRFFTKSDSRFNGIYKMFYRNNRKIVPDIKLNPMILAIWFMDDGSRSRDSDVYLNTQQFSLSDQRKLLKMLLELKIKARLNKDKKYYRIRILKESIKHFNQLINPFVISSMRYKLSYNPVETWANARSVSNSKH